MNEQLRKQNKTCVVATQSNSTMQIHKQAVFMDRYFAINGELTYLIQVSGNEGDSITSCCHFDEATEDSVSHWGVLIHAMEQITQTEKTQRQSGVK